MKRQVKVSDYYHSVATLYNLDIATKFLKLMVAWDGRKSVINSYYDKDVCDMMLKDALGK